MTDCLIDLSLARSSDIGPIVDVPLLSPSSGAAVVDDVVMDVVEVGYSFPVPAVTAVKQVVELTSHVLVAKPSNDALVDVRALLRSLPNAEHVPRICRSLFQGHTNAQYIRGNHRPRLPSSDCGMCFIGSCPLFLVLLFMYMYISSLSSVMRFPNAYDDLGNPIWSPACVPPPRPVDTGPYSRKRRRCYSLMVTSAERRSHEDPGVLVFGNSRIYRKFYSYFICVVL